MSPSRFISPYSVVVLSEKEACAVSFEYCVGLALDLMLTAGNGVSDTGAPSMNLCGVRSRRFVVERRSRYSAVADQEALVRKFCGCTRFEEYRHDLIVDPVKRIPQETVSGARYYPRCVAEQRQRSAHVNAGDVGVRCVIEYLSGGNGNERSSAVTRSRCR